MHDIDQIAMTFQFRGHDFSQSTKGASPASPASRPMMMTASRNSVALSGGVVSLHPPLSLSINLARRTELLEPLFLSPTA